MSYIVCLNINEKIRKVYPVCTVAYVTTYNNGVVIIVIIIIMAIA